MRKKGFTLIELLVVIAIIAMLLAILMPALNKVKRLAQRLVCGTNVKGLGTAMQVYAQDFEDRYPVQGGRGNPRWSDTLSTGNWWDPGKNWSQTNFVTVSASLYLLVRNADVDPKSFVCKSGDETPFPGVGGTGNLDLVELWDFGGKDPTDSGIEYDGGYPRDHVSYAYQLPYRDLATGTPPHPASSASSASAAVLADKNPWQDPKLDNGSSLSDAEKQKSYMTLIDRLAWKIDSTSAWQAQIANSQPHGREGQNVLFGDGHATFERRSDVSYLHDNIYTMFNINTCGDNGPFTEACRRKGMNLDPADNPSVVPTSPGGAASYSVTSEDTLLVNDDKRDDL